MSAHVQQTPSSEAPADEVVFELGRADEEMRAAIDSFRRARRMRVFEFFRPVNTDPSHRGPEEVHVGHGITALLNAERHVDSASATIHDLPAEHPARRRLGPSVRSLDAQFKSILKSLRDHPDPSRIVTELKAARRIIPTRVVRG